MAREATILNSTGQPAYAAIFGPQGTAWNGTALENVNAAHWGTYELALVAQSGGSFFTLDVPALPVGKYTLAFFLQSGDAPAVTDECVHSRVLYWNGTEEVDFIGLWPKAPGPSAIPVDHNYPSAGAQLITDPSGNPLVGAVIQVYLTTDYNAGHRGTGYLAGQTLSAAGGRWVAPIALYPGTYTVVVTDTNYQSGTFSLVVSS